MSTPEITVLLGVDTKTARQLEISIETWAKYRPEMFTMPWLVFYDRDQLQPGDIRLILQRAGKRSDVRAVAWPTVPGASYANQRERMLTGFCHVCRWVETPWWMKVDTDAVALREADWLDPEWFAPDLSTPIDAAFNRYDPSYACIVASPWGYTKPADQMARLDDWGDTVPELRRFPRLDLPHEPGGRRCRHKRIASWLSFYRADWTRMAADMALHYTTGQCRIPVPSQDGYHFYVAKRRGDRIIRAQMKRRGWTNCPRLEGLRQTAEQALRGEYAK